MNEKDKEEFLKKAKELLPQLEKAVKVTAEEARKAEEELREFLAQKKKEEEEMAAKEIEEQKNSKQTVEVVSVALDPFATSYGFLYKFYNICKNKEGSLVSDMEFEEFLSLPVSEMFDLSGVTFEDCKDLLSE